MTVLPINRSQKTQSRIKAVNSTWPFSFSLKIQRTSP
jgi:hypothetical protein